jgi:hypothetical protein
MSSNFYDHSLTLNFYYPPIFLFMNIDKNLIIYFLNKIKTCQRAALDMGAFFLILSLYQTKIFQKNIPIFNRGVCSQHNILPVKQL